MSSDSLYRNYHIHYDPPPIPYRGADWHYYHKDYDGPGDSRHGDCASEQACKDEIDEILADEGDDKLEIKYNKNVCVKCGEMRNPYCRCDEDWFFDMDGKP